jgi:hypothetical protein
MQEEEIMNKKTPSKPVLEILRQNGNAQDKCVCVCVCVCVYVCVQRVCSVCALFRS